MSAGATESVYLNYAVIRPWSVKFINPGQSGVLTLSESIQSGQKDKYPQPTTLDTALPPKLDSPATMLRYSVKLFRVGLALILGLWIAGAGCMLGCQSMVASAAGNEAGEPAAEEHHLAMIVSGEACATNQGHDCCAKKKAEAAKAKPSAPTAKPTLQTAALISQTESLSPEPSGRMRDCPLALSRAVVTTKTSGGKQVAAPLALTLKALPVQTSAEQHTSLSHVVRLPNRGHTYLRCCVFLI